MWNIFHTYFGLQGTIMVFVGNFIAFGIFYSFGTLTAIGRSVSSYTAKYNILTSITPVI